MENKWTLVSGCAFVVTKKDEYNRHIIETPGINMARPGGNGPLLQTKFVYHDSLISISQALMK